jgi:hypothetical protein
LPLESFDAIGGWREHYRIPVGDGTALDPKRKDQWPVTYKRGMSVDCTGNLPTGEAFADIRELKALLKRDPDRVARCLAEKLLIYALGRGLGFSDRQAVEAIASRVREQNYGFRSLLQEVVASESFIRP